MRRLWILLLWVALVAGCRSDADFATLTANAPDDTPTQETLQTPLPATATPIFSTITPTPRPVDCVYSPVLRDGFCLLNANATLDGEPLNVEWEYRIRQEYPPGYELYNLVETVTGGGADQYADWLGIEAQDDGYQFIIAGRAAQAGFITPFIIAHYEQCVLIKITGHSSIQTISHFGWNYNVGIIVERQGGAPYMPDSVRLPELGDYAAVWPVYLSPWAYRFTAFIAADYATALPGTDITIEAIAIGRDIDGDHCNLSTPKL